MEKAQTIEDFYRLKLNWMPDNLRNEIGHFNVFKIADFVGLRAKPMPYNRKDYFKISLKATTNKTTSELIAERLIQEAVALLKHTTWNVSEIAYSLGFEEPTHFNNFFKKRTRQTPGNFRTV